MHDAATRIERARRAHRAIVARGHPELQAELEVWAKAQAAVRVAHGTDGNAVRTLPDGTVQLGADHAGAARKLIETNRGGLSGANAPIVIEGVDPPWLTLAVARATPALPTGYQPEIWLVQRSASEFFDGCSLADLAGLLGEDRVRVFVGENAAERLADEMDRTAARLPQACIVLPSVRARMHPPVADTLRAGAARQTAEHARCLGVIRQRDGSIDCADRIAALQAGGSDRRVTLIAGRFTTVLKPMIDDLAEAFEAAGWRTQTISEPSDHRQLAPASYSTAIEAFDPNLIVAANHSRSDVDRILGGPTMPRNVPWATWVQDAMPHLLGPAAGRAIGPADLAIGHIGGEMLRSCGYPAERSIAAPMVASERKFAPRRPESRCEPVHVAAFTNHSETPEAMRARLIREASATHGLAPIVSKLAEAALEIAQQPMHRVHAGHACKSATRAIAAGADEATIENLSQNVALRLVDRVHRHRVLAWARDICTARGWTMRLYGRGWSEHGGFAAVAGGELPHGPLLAQAYANAGLTLQVSSIAPMHQRVIECALAGGLPAIVATHGAITLAQARLVHAVLENRQHQGVRGEPHNGRPTLWFDRFSLPEADRRAKLVAIRGDAEPTPPAGAPPNAVAIPDADPATRPDVPEELDADAMVGLLELGFWDEPSLERLVERAVADRAWRAAEAERIAARARLNCTHASLVRRIEGYYAELAASGAPASSAAV